MFKTYFQYRHRRIKLYLVCFLLGIILAHFLGNMLIVISVVSLLGVGVVWSFGAGYWRCGLIMLVIFALGIARYQLARPGFSEYDITHWHGKEITFVGRVVDEPDVRINGIFLTIAAQSVNNQAISGLVIARRGLYPVYSFGDVVEVTCDLKKPEAFSDFAYDRYLALRGIYSQCQQSRLRLLTAATPLDSWRTMLLWFKERCRSAILLHIPEPQASLLYAMLFGPRGGIPADLVAAFTITGTSHLVAISGSNMTIVIVSAAALLSLTSLSRRQAFWLISVFLTAYVLTVGLSASVVRAAIMGWLVLLGKYLGRIVDGSRLLLVAASVMVWLKPTIITDDVGFQLSFMAVAGLLYVMPIIESRVTWVPAWLGIRESFATTLAATAGTLPVMLYHFGRLSLISPLVNIFVVPTLTYIMILGLPATFLTVVLPNYGVWILTPLYFIAHYITTVVTLSARVPGATLQL